MVKRSKLDVTIPESASRFFQSSAAEGNSRCNDSVQNWTLKETKNVSGLLWSHPGLQVIPNAKVWGESQIPPVSAGLKQIHQLGCVLGLAGWFWLLRS